MQWNYQLTKKNWPVCELGTVYYLTSFDFKICLCTRKVTVSFKKQAPGHPDSKQPCSRRLPSFLSGVVSKNGVGKLAAAQGLFLMLVRHSFLNAGRPGCSNLGRN